MATLNHNNLVKSVAFSPDGKYAISGWVDRTARCSGVLASRVFDLNQTCDSMTCNLTKDEMEDYLEGEPYQAICPQLSI